MSVKLCRADRSGVEATVAMFDCDDVASALRARDAKRERSNPRQVHYRVIDEEAVDVGSSGELEWCEACGLEVAAPGRPWCAGCDDPDPEPIAA